MKAIDKFEFDVKMFDQALAEFIDSYNELLKEVEELREYKKNATRKHWQTVAANNNLKWHFAEKRIERALDFIWERYKWKDAISWEDTQKLIDILDKRIDD